nr:hypothetical protein [Parazoarcus communis]
MQLMNLGAKWKSRYQTLIGCYVSENRSDAGRALRGTAMSCAALLISVASGSPPLTDGIGGMTCRHFATDSRMAWQQKGGDWADAHGKPYGDAPYSTASLALVQGRQAAYWNVTALAQAWQTGSGPSGAILLRAVPGTLSGAVNFNSRENGDASAHPELVIEREGGGTIRTHALADAHLPCSTHAGVGQRPVFQVGGATTAILIFGFDPNDKRRIIRAELRLTTDKVYDRSTSIGVYRPTLPGEAEKVTNGLASGYPQDRGIESHPAVVFAERFESANWASRWSSHSKNGTAEIISRDEANRFEPLDARALKVTVRKGSVLGLNSLYRFDQQPGGEPDAMYFRYYLRFGESWNPTLEGGKLPGFAGTYGRGGWGGRKASGVNGWSARGAFFRLHQTDAVGPAHRSIGSYIYHVDTPEDYGSIWGWNRGPTGILEKNRWYSVEQYVRLNTPGKNDGVMRAWVDGILAFEKVDLRYRDLADLKIEMLWMNVYHGGTRPPNEDLALFIDNLVIAREYIGPLSGSR